MRLSKAGYYADFLVYPPLILAMVAAVLARPASLSWVDWLVACLVGVAMWTLLEYLFHRFVLHQVRFFAELHDMHHEDPHGFVGTPTWFSAGVIGFGVLAPLWWNLGFDIASGVTAGMMLGYLWYVTVHHIVHHWRIEPSSYFYRAKRRHALHHYGRQPCNFGVSTAFWDRVFGTTAHERRR